MIKYEVLGYDRHGAKIKHCITEPDAVAAKQRFLRVHPEAKRTEMIEVFRRAVSVQDKPDRQKAG